MLRYSRVLEIAKDINKKIKDGQQVSEADLKYLEGARKVFRGNVGLG